MSPGAPRLGTSAVRMSFIVGVLRCTEVRSRARSAGGRGVGQQRDLAGVLDRDRDVTLVLTAVAGDPARPDLAAVGDELPQQAGVLVVDVLGLVLAECAHLLLRLAQDGLCHFSMLLEWEELRRGARRRRPGRSRRAGRNP